MRLSLSYAGFGPIAPAVRAVRAVEDAGLDGVSAAEHVGFHDVIVPSALFLTQTRHIEVGIVGPAPVSRHPGLLAMELASLAELGPGRIRVQVGLGDPFLVGRIGGRQAGGLRQVEEFVSALRGLLSGKRLDGTYCGHGFEGYRLAAVVPPPAIDVMAVRPRMLALAARVGDGVSLSAGASRNYLARAVRDIEQALAERGRDRTDYRITAMALGGIAATSEGAAAPVISTLTHFSAEALSVLAPDLLGPEATAATPGAVGRSLTMEIVAEMAVVATPESLPAVLADYAATGIDELSVNLLNPSEQIPDLLPLLAAARP